MNTSRSTNKKVVGGLAVVALLGLGGASLAGAAESHRVPFPKPPAVIKVPEYVQLPEVGMREITAPGGEVQTRALFRNGKVYRVAQPVRVFEVDHGNGHKGTRKQVGREMVVVNPDGTFSPLPPIVPGPAHDRGPTPEQLAEMHYIAGVDPVTGMPIPPRP